MIFGMWVGLGLKLRILNFGRGRCLSKYLIFIIYAKICPEHFSGTVCPTWMIFVGRARAEGAHGDLDGGQRSSEVKWGKLCAMTTIFGQKKP